MLTKSGRRITLEINTRFFYRAGEAAGVQGIARDVSARKRFEEEETARANKILDEVKRHAGGLGVACGAVIATGDTPYRAIIEQAGKSGCDLIVMASHGRRGLEGVLLGSVTQQVLTHSKVPVLVCR